MSADNSHNEWDSNQQNHSKRPNDSYSLPYNEEFEIKKDEMVSLSFNITQMQIEFKIHPERFRLLAHSLTQFVPINKNKFIERKRHML